MPSFLSLCLALLRLAIQTTTRMQGLLINLHNTVEGVIERQGDSLRIRSTDAPSTSRSMPLPSTSTDAPDIPSDHVTPSISTLSTADNVLEMIATSQSRTEPPAHTVPERVIPLSNETTTSAEERTTVFQPDSNTEKSDGHLVSEDGAKIREIELSLKFYNKEPTSEPVPSILPQKADESGDTRDYEDQSSFVGVTRLSNEAAVVFKSSTTCIEDDSSNLDNNESKWLEYRMMLKWYRNEPVDSRSLPNENISNTEESTVEPLDLSMNSENAEDAHELEVTKHPSPLPTLLKAESDTRSMLPKSSCQSTPVEEADCSISYEPTTRNALITAHEIQGTIHSKSPKQDSADSTELKADLKHTNKKSETKASSDHATESACRSQIRVSTDESESDVALEVKALPKSGMKMREPRLTSGKLAYDIDLKFEKNLLLKEYDTSTIREKATSKITKSPVRDSTTQPTKSKIESTKMTPSPVRHSPSNRAKSGKTPVKTNEQARRELKTNEEKSKKTPSFALDTSQSLSLPQFRVDSSTGNVQWKCDLHRNTSSESKQSPYKQHKTSTVAEIDKKLNRGNEPISAARFPIHGTSTPQVVSGGTRLVPEQLSKTLEGETTSTSEEEVQFKPTRERRPTPPARFIIVESSTDSENAEGSRVKSPSVAGPTEISTVEEFKPTRERRPTPAARFPNIEFSADGEEKDDQVTVAEVDFKPTRERRLTPAAKFVDHDSKTSSENNSDDFYKSNPSSISLPHEVSNYQGRSPLKAQQKRSPTSVVRFQELSSPRRNFDNRSESLASRNMSSDSAESDEIAYKPTRERRPTPAAIFLTPPESTDGETAGVNPLEPGHALPTESSATREVKLKPCEPIPSPAAGFSISGSPVGTTGVRDVSFKSKLSPRHERQTSASPKNRNRKSPKSGTSPTVTFQIPESKRENTGLFRRESKLPSRKTTNETSTSEEECDSNRTSRRGAKPVKVPFKSPRKSPKSFRFSPHKASNEKKVETWPICEGNTLSSRRSLSKELSNTKKSVERESKPDEAESSCPQPHIGESSTIEEVQTGSQSNESSVLTRDKLSSKNDEGYSAPGNASQSHTEFSNNRMDDNAKESNSTPAFSLEETSVRQGIVDDSTSKRAVNPCLQPVTSESQVNAENAENTSSGTDSTSSESSTSETSTSEGSGSDSSPEGTAGLFPQPTHSETPKNADTASDTRPGNNSIPESTPNEGCGDTSPKEAVEICPNPENKSPTNAESVDDISSATDSTSSESTSVESTGEGSEDDSAPERTAGYSPPPTNESMTNAKDSAETTSGTNSTSSEATPCETSISHDSGGNSILDKKAYSNESPNKSDDANDPTSGTVSTISESTQSSTSTSDGSVENVILDNTAYTGPKMSTRESPLNTNGAEDPTSGNDSTESTSETTTDGSGGDSASEGTADLCVQPKISKSFTNAEPSDNLGVGAYSTSSKYPPNDTMTSKESSGGNTDFKGEGPCPLPDATESPVDTDYTNSKTDSTSSESTLNKTSSAGSGRDSVPEGIINLSPQSRHSISPTSAENFVDINERTNSPSLKSTSNGKSVSQESGIYTAAERASSSFPQSATRESPSNSDDANDPSFKTDSASSESTPSKTTRSVDDSSPEGATELCAQHETTKFSTNAEGSFAFTATTDSTSSEYKSSERSTIVGYVGNSFRETTRSPCPQPDTQECSASTEKIECSSKTDSTSSESTSRETLTIDGPSSDFASERAAVFNPQLDNSEFQTSTENVGDIRAGTVSRSSESSPSETSSSDGSKENRPPEGEVDHCPHPETWESPNAVDMNDTSSESEQAYLVIMPSEDSSTDVEGNFSPEGAVGIHNVLPVDEIPGNGAISNGSIHNLLPVQEISANGTISDASHSESETVYSVSFPSESSASEGEFILEQGDFFQSQMNLSPTNGESNSESEAMSLPMFRQTPTSEVEYIRPVAYLAESKLESQENGKETGENGSESDAVSSLSSPSEPSKSDEDSESGVCIEVETTSDPQLSSCYLRTNVKKVCSPNSSEPQQLAELSIAENFDTSETCDAPTTLSLISETKNMEDTMEKDTNVYEQLKESLKMSCEDGVVADSDEIAAENILLPNALSQSQSQFPGSDFTQNPDSLPSTEEPTACNTSATTEDIDATKFLDTLQTQPCITGVPPSAMEIESITSEKELKTKLRDSLELADTKMANVALAPEDASTSKESASEDENKSIVVVNSQADNFSTEESIVTKEVIKMSSFHEASNACDAVRDNTVIPKESITSQSLASDVSTGTKISLYIDTQNCENPINPEESEPVEATNREDVTFYIHGDVQIMDSPEQISHFGETPALSESLAMEETHYADQAETCDIPISTPLTTCEVPNVDNTETDMPVASEMLICDAPSEFLAKLNDGSDFEITRSLSFENEMSPMIQYVITANDESSSDAPVEVASNSMDKCDNEVATRTIVSVTSITEQASDGSEFVPASATLDCDLPGKMDCTEVGYCSALETIPSELPNQHASIDLALNEIVNDPVVSHLNCETSSDWFGNDSAPEGAAFSSPNPETSVFPSNSDNIDDSAGKNSLSEYAASETSATDCSGTNCPIEGETGHFSQPTTCEFPNPEGMDSTHLDYPVGPHLDNCETSTSNGSESESAHQWASRFCSKPETTESTTNTDNLIDGSAETNSLSEFTQSESSASDGPGVNFSFEEEASNCLHPAICDSLNADPRSNNPVVSDLDNCEVTTIAESAEKSHGSDSFGSATAISIGAEHAEMVRCLKDETPALSEPIICDIPTCEDAEIDPVPSIENSIISELLILDVVPRVKFESDNEHVATQSIITDFSKRVTHTETLVNDSPEISESINYKMSADVPDVNTDNLNSERNVNSEGPIYDTSNASGVETKDNCDAEEIIVSESLAKQVTPGEDLSESKESCLSESPISGMKSPNVTELNNGADFQMSVASEFAECGLSNDGTKSFEPDDAPKLEVYIAPEPVTGDIAFNYIYSSLGLESSIKVLTSSETPTGSSPNTDHNERSIPNSKAIDSESDFCNESIAAEHEKADEGQDCETGLATESVICDTPTNSDIVDASISETAVDIVPMVSQEPTNEDKSTDDYLVLNISEPLFCEVSKDECIENLSVLEESTSSTSSLVVEGDLDSKPTADNMHDNDSKKVAEEGESSVITVENKAWKKKSRKSKKKRKH